MASIMTKQSTKAFTYIFLIVLFCDFAQIQEILPVLGSIHLQKILFLLAFLGIIYDPTFGHSLQINTRSKQIKILGFLIFWMIASIPTSVHIGNSIAFLTNNLWKVMATFFLIIAYCHSLQAIGQAMWLCAMGVGVMSFFGIIRASSMRLQITESYDSNELALIIVTVFPYALWKIFGSRGLTKVIAICACGAMIISLMKTGSRGAFLGMLGISMITLFSLHALDRRVFLKLMLFYLLGGVFVFLVGTSQYWERILTIINPEQDYNLTSPGGRMAVWMTGLELFMENPILGIGIDGFIRAEGLTHLARGGKWSAAHNSFLQVLAELGLPGLVAYCSIIWITVKGIREARRKLIASQGVPLSSDNGILIANQILASWAGFLICGFFLSMAYATVFFAILAFSLAFISNMQGVLAEMKPDSSSVNRLSKG